MKLQSIFLAFAAYQLAASHTLFTTLFVNDVNQGDGTCVREPKDNRKATDPVRDLQSKDMMCGFDGETPVDRVCSVPQSAKLSFLFRWYPDGSVEGSIDISHKGPCAVYMKPQGVDGDWFKIWDEGYDEKTKEWCTGKLIKNKGLLSVKVPSNLRGGNYLVRTELLTLNDADKTPPQPQYYISCAQIFLNSTGTALPSDTVKIPGHVSIENPFVVYNIYEKLKLPYLIPGPKRYVSGASPTVKIEAAKAQKEGFLPSNVIVTNANWWGFEVPKYTDETSCWKSSTESCWPQVKKCYDVAPPSGHKGCSLMEAKCEVINSNCKSPNPNGPPNSGKSLEATPSTYSIPAAEEVDVAESSQAPTVPTTVPTTFVSVTSAAPVTTSTKKPDSAAYPPEAAKIVLTSAATLPESTPTQVPQNLAPPLSVPSDPSTDTPDTTSTITTYTTVFITSNPIATDGSAASASNRCGSEGSGLSCSGSAFGRCCSVNSSCGNTLEHCGSGKCQPGYGKCGEHIAKDEANKARQKRVQVLVDRVLKGKMWNEKRHGHGHAR